MNRPERIDLSPEAIATLKKQLDACHCIEDKATLWGVIEFAIWLQSEVKNDKITIHKLKRIYGFKTEKKSNLANKLSIKVSQNAQSNDIETSLSQTSSATPPDPTTVDNPPKKQKGHGRNGVDAYFGAKEVFVPSQFKAGDPCPIAYCDGRLYPVKPGLALRVTGDPIASATIYKLEKFRCSICGNLSCATLPKGVSSEKYDERIKANICFCKYFMGLPFYRIEMAQALLGVPLPDATQWGLVKEVIACVNPIFLVLEKMAAQGYLFHGDDTMVRILSLIRENKINPDITRKGMFTSGFASFVEDKIIYLFYSGRRHAGENIGHLVGHKENINEKAIIMVDALSSNKPKGVPKNLLAKFIIAFCLAHGRRKFFEIFDFFPKECEFVLNIFEQVYKNDAFCKSEKMDPKTRLEYHQKHSRPLMMELKRWLRKQLSQKLVEENGSLGKAIKYMLNHWKNLTRFLNVPGAPLDNNLIERALKIPIRNRKNAMFYKTTDGARAGDILMSIICSCVANGVNPIEYLIICQRYKHEIALNPDAWMPWNYHTNLEEYYKQAA